MKHLAPTLTAIALMGAAPAFGASIADDLVIKPTVQIQVRAQFGASGTNNAGDDYNIYNGANGENESARFSVRRARFGASAKNSTGWDAVLQIRAAERYDAGAPAGTVTGSTVTGRSAELYYANIGKTFKTDSLENRIHVGLDKPFNGESSISSSTYMFPSDRVGAHYLEYRAVGVGYTMTHELFKFGVDVQNTGGESNNGIGGTGTTSTEEKNGLFYSARVELSPGAEYMPKKKMESFAGAEGFHAVLGLDYQNDHGALQNAAGDIRSVQTWGPDLLVHFNGLSALAEYRARTGKRDNEVAADPDDVKGTMFDVLIGYAIPLEAGFAIEPAIRYGKVDLDKDDPAGEAVGPFNQGEYRAGSSGSQWDIGVNFYWNGHANKTQLAYTSWTGEEPAAGDKAKAHVFTLQQQVLF